MKREQEEYILVSSPRVTELLKKMIEKGGEALSKVDVPNLADYSAGFENIDRRVSMIKEELRPCKIELPERIISKVITGGYKIPFERLKAESHNGKFHKWIDTNTEVKGLIEYEDGTMHLIPMEYITFDNRDSKILDKQTPMEHHQTKVCHIDNIMRLSVCPSCLCVICTDKDKYPLYCNWCGQAIEWNKNRKD